MPRKPPLNRTLRENPRQSSSPRTIETSVTLPELFLNLQPSQGLSGHSGMSHVIMSPIGILDPPICESIIVDLCSREWSEYGEYGEIWIDLVDELSFEPKPQKPNYPLRQSERPQ